MRIVDMSIRFAALCGRFHGYVRKKIDRSPNLLASLNCSERAEFEDDFAVSLDTSGLKSLHFIFIWKIDIATTRHSNASETILKHCIETTD